MRPVDPSFQELNLLAAAYHEAGHAVMSWRGGLEVCERGIEANDSEQCAHVGPHLLPHSLGLLEERFSKDETAHAQFLRQVRADDGDESPLPAFRGKVVTLMRIVGRIRPIPG